MAQAVGQWFISLLALIFIPRIKAEQQVPDVLRCRRCKECQLTSYGGSISKDDGASMPSSASSSSFGPAVLGRPWDLIPSCQQCQGCNTHLESIKTGFKLYNRTFALEPPMSSSSTYVFQATTDLLPPGQRAVVKVFCVPPSDDTWSLLSAVDRIQACSARAYKRTQLVLALYHIGQDCGMTDLLPKMWVANVTGVIPGDGKASGRVISWLALWAERVQGLSLRSFLSASQLPPQLVMDTMHRKLNSTQVVLAAIFDLLTSQRDGHTKI
uniref:Uncharacterized protein n=1 Tax=Dunaliella tertiolecta TaxID=3047 RepID=A0A7S3QRI4_DUNTE